MRNFILSIVCFSLISSAVCAVRPGLLTLVVDAGEIMAKRAMSTLRITPGFRPEHPPVISFHPIERPGRVRFLDDTHEFYVPVNRQVLSPLEVSSPKVTREDNHSVRVDLDQKKK